MYFAVLMIVGGVLGGLVAGNKGRNVLGWTLACGVMPLLVLILFALPVLPRAGVSRVCPHCLRVIPWQADTCAYCRREVENPGGALCAACGRLISEQEKFCSNCGRAKE
jgi:RNA polymerase subunit RPABC4/transcription elongation factor Spt4